MMAAPAGVPASGRPALDTSSRSFSTVTVFGGVTVDRIGTTERPPVMGASNPGSVRAVPGGVGLNVASILARLGLTVRLVARVGADAGGDAVVAAAAAVGIDTAAIGRSPDGATAQYQAAFNDTGGLIVGIADIGLYDEMTPELVAPTAADAPADDFWVIDANLPRETLGFLVEEAGASGRQIAGMTVSPAKARRLGATIDRLTYLFANKAEAVAIVGEEAESHTAQSLASALARRSSARVAVTDGANPLAAAGDGESRSFAPLRADITGSVNGAGDSLAAGTIFGLSSGRSFNEAIRIGLAAAALTLRSGGVAAAPYDPAQFGAPDGARQNQT
jgi:pseudouridine kinase